MSLDPVMLMKSANTDAETARTMIQIGLASGSSFDCVPKERPGLWFQDLVRLGYFTKHYRMEGDNVADIDYRNASPMDITVDGKVVKPGDFVEW